MTSYEALNHGCMQEGSHDSVIDARTALDLVHLKIKHGEYVSDILGYVSICTFSVKSW